VVVVVVDVVDDEGADGGGEAERGGVTHSCVGSSRELLGGLFVVGGMRCLTLTYCTAGYGTSTWLYGDTTACRTSR
jgi:hypothetical protein